MMNLVENMKFEFENVPSGTAKVEVWRTKLGVSITNSEDDFADFYEDDIPHLISALQSAYDYMQQQKENQ
jgi:hypothetical protein